MPRGRYSKFPDINGHLLAMQGLEQGGGAWLRKTCARAKFTQDVYKDVRGQSPHLFNTCTASASLSASCSPSSCPPLPSRFAAEASQPRSKINEYIVCPSPPPSPLPRCAPRSIPICTEGLFSLKSAMRRPTSASDFCEQSMPARTIHQDQIAASRCTSLLPLNPTP